VVAEAGTVHFLTLDEIRAAIRELGFTPRQRNVFYELIDEAAEPPAEVPLATNRLPILPIAR
jgi:cyclic dehypoxanthinyl futalosine synthase